MTIIELVPAPEAAAGGASCAAAGPQDGETTARAGRGGARRADRLGDDVLVARQPADYLGLRVSGRAGRDGLPSDCVLLYEEADLLTQMEFLRWSNPDVEFYERVYDLLVHNREQVNAFGLEWMRERLHARQKHDRRLETVLGMLERYGVVEGTWEPMRLTVLGEIADELKDQDRLAAKLLRDQQKLLALVQFVRNDGERKKYIHEYFGIQNPVNSDVKNGRPL